MSSEDLLMSTSAATDVDIRRAELVAAGVRVLRRLGFNGMTLREVAKEAGVSIGLLQHYFETRERLGQICFAAACGERARAIAESDPREGSAWNRIVGIIDRAFDPSAIAERAATWIDLCAAAPRDSVLRKEAAKVQNVWRSALAAPISDGVANGELTLRLDRDATVETLLALIDGAEIAATISGKGFHPDAPRAATIDVARSLLGLDTARRT
jgi:AcrR family transcriptional regulator